MAGRPHCAFYDTESRERLPRNGTVDGKEKERKRRSQMGDNMRTRNIAEQSILPREQDKTAQPDKPVICLSAYGRQGWRKKRKESQQKMANKARDKAWAVRAAFFLFLVGFAIRTDKGSMTTANGRAKRGKKAKAHNHVKS